MKAVIKAAFVLRVSEIWGLCCGLCWGCTSAQACVTRGLQGFWDLATLCSGLSESGACCGRCWASKSLSGCRLLQTDTAGLCTTSNLNSLPCRSQRDAQRLLSPALPAEGNLGPQQSFPLPCHQS